MTGANAKVMGWIMDEYSIDLRTAAFVLAIRRVSEAAMARTYVEEDIQL